MIGSDKFGVEVVVEHARDVQWRLDMAADILIHPATECFRLMNEEELAALAADISENGQTDPIIVGQVNSSGDEFVVDGRNRLKACKIAGVEPKLERRQF